MKERKIFSLYIQKKIKIEEKKNNNNNNNNKYKKRAKYRFIYTVSRLLLWTLVCDALSYKALCGAFIYQENQQNRFIFHSVYHDKGDIEYLLPITDNDNDNKEKNDIEIN